MGVLSTVILPFLFLIVTSTGSATGKGIRVESYPKRVKQGDVLLLRVSGPDSLRSAYGEFHGERLPMAFVKETATYEGLIGIDMNTLPGRYEAKVFATDEKGRLYRSFFSLRVERVDFGTEALSLPPSMVDLDAKTLERVDREARRLEALFRTFREERLWEGSFVRPVEGEVVTGFGVNRVINRKRRSRHTGVDLRAEEGTSVLATNRGRVILVDELFFSGKSVILDHGWGLYSMYFHLSEVLVKEGEGVPKGGVLGRVGSTGRSSGPHLHWGVRLRGARVDPLSLLRIERESIPTEDLRRKD